MIITRIFPASTRALLAGIAYKSQPKPALSRLTNIEVDGTFTYGVNTDLVVTVSAVYNNGFTRDVTEKAILTGVDMSQNGEQLLTVTYNENGTEICKQMLVDIVLQTYDEDAEILPGEISEVPDATVTFAPQDTSEGENSATAPLWPFLLLAALLALLILLIRLKSYINRI